MLLKQIQLLTRRFLKGCRHRLEESLKIQIQLKKLIDIISYHQENIELFTTGYSLVFRTTVRGFSDYPFLYRSCSTLTDKTAQLIKIG